MIIIYLHKKPVLKTEVTDSALTEIFSILDNYTNTGLTNEELNSTKESYLNSAAMKYETPNQKLGFLNRILTYDLDPSYIDKQADILNDMTLTEVNSLASSKIKPNEIEGVSVQKEQQQEMKTLWRKW